MSTQSNIESGSDSASIDHTKNYTCCGNCVPKTQFLNIRKEEAQFDIITTDSLLIKTVTPVDRKEDTMQISPIRRN